MLNLTAQEELRRHESKPVLVYGSLHKQNCPVLKFDTTMVPPKGRLGKCQDLMIEEKLPLCS